VRRLLIRPGAIGDCIVSLPALESLESGYTEVWTAGQNVSLIRFADRVRSIASTGLDLLGLPAVEPPPGLLSTLASFDSVVSWYGANRPEFRTAVSGFPFHFFPALPASGAGKHAVDFYLEQALSIGGSAVDPVPRIEAPGSAEGFAVIHPFSGGASKNWPIESYRELARRIEKRLPVRWCAGPEEPLQGAVRIDDLYALATWLKSGTMYIGNDSGITHLAAAVGVPTVAVFGPTDPLVWGPRGAAVRVVGVGTGRAVSEVPVEMVAAAIESWL
jgi:hypothetical protein